MNTPIDWLAVAAFSALVALFIHRHAAPHADTVAFHHYVIPAIAMATMNILGNMGETAGAIGAWVIGVAYAFGFLRLGAITPR